MILFFKKKMKIKNKIKDEELLHCSYEQWCHLKTPQFFLYNGNFAWLTKISKIEWIIIVQLIWLHCVMFIINIKLNFLIKLLCTQTRITIHWNNAVMNFPNYLKIFELTIRGKIVFSLGSIGHCQVN